MELVQSIQPTTYFLHLPVLYTKRDQTKKKLKQILLQL